MRIHASALMALLLALAGSSAAADPPPTPSATPPRAPSPVALPLGRAAPSGPQSGPIPLRYQGTALETVVRHLAGRTGRALLLESSVKPHAQVTIEAEATSLEDALTRLTEPLRLTWRKSYLPERSGGWTGDQVRRAARALESLEGAGVIVEEPTASKATLFMRSIPPQVWQDIFGMFRPQ